MFAPESSLWDLIVSREENALELLKARLEGLKTEVGYPPAHTREAEEAFEAFVQTHLITPLAGKTLNQMKPFYQKMAERCFELGYRVDEEMHAVFVDAENQPIEHDERGHVAAFLVDSMLAAPGVSRNINLMTFVLDDAIQSVSARYNAPAVAVPQ
ncbi:MAG: hypothetical protein NTW08_09020 [Gammaproteobacteria bacterium]|nr:hypothetical protein [Gammaproteobacteria bacterium]